MELSGWFPAHVPDTAGVLQHVSQAASAALRLPLQSHHQYSVLKCFLDAVWDHLHPEEPTHENKQPH